MRSGPIVAPAPINLTGPTDWRVMSVLPGVVPTHPVATECVRVCSYRESQLVGADRMAGVRPHLAARIRSRERIDVHVQGSRNFRGPLLAVDPIGDRDFSQMRWQGLRTPRERAS